MSERDSRRATSAAIIAAFVFALAGLGWMWTTVRASSAEFADTEVVANNSLGAGTIDIASGEATELFSATNLAAGDTATGQLEIANRGTLPLRFELRATATASPLRDVMEVVVWTAADTCAPSAPAGADVWRPLQQEVASGVGTGALAPGQSQLMCMSARVPLDAPSAVQGRRLDLIVGAFAVHDLDASIANEPVETAPPNIDDGASTDGGGGAPAPAQPPASDDEPSTTVVPIDASAPQGVDS